MVDSNLAPSQTPPPTSAIVDQAINNTSDAEGPPTACVPESPANRIDGTPATTTGGFRREFLMAFIAIFLAELGDKTQLSTLLMTAQSHAPWVVFLGAATALIVTSMLGVLVGRWLAKYLPPAILRTASGVTLLVISSLLFWDIVHP